MDLNDIVIFARVAQSGSFTAAARLLDMPKSSVSRRVAALEERIGARLLQRTTRKLGLTDAGRLYYDYALRIAHEVEEAGEAVSRMQAAPRGLLRVTAPLAFGMLGPIVAELLVRHPEVQVELYCSDRQVDLVEEGFDVAIRAGRLSDSTLVARPLGGLKRVVVAAASYCKQHGTPRGPADLARHSCISFAAGITPGVWTLHSGERTQEVRVGTRLVINDLEIMAAVVRAGVGIGLMPELVVKADLASGRLTQVLPRWSSSATPVYAVYPTARQLSPKVRAFIDLLRERLALDPLPEATRRAVADGRGSGRSRRGAARS